MDEVETSDTEHSGRTDHAHESFEMADLDVTTEYPHDAKDGADDDVRSEGYEPLHDAAVYETVVDLSDDNDAHSLIVKLVGEGKRVLELGCATGSTTKVLQQMGCTVVAVEIDREAAQVAESFAERVIVADLDVVNVREALGDDSYDVIVAADVLEHLRDPGRTLTACLDHLRPGGEVLLSIPNIAHADVRLSLLRGQFDYQEWGLLDETHLRFFTRRSLHTFLIECGLAPLRWERTRRAVGHTEVEWQPFQDDGLVEWVAGQPDADTYQFIVRAVAAPADSHLHEVATMLGEAQSELEALRDLLPEGQQLAEDNARLAEDNERLVDGVAKLELLVAELQASSNAADATIARAQADAKDASEQLRHVWRQVDGLTIERDRYRSSFDLVAGVQQELVAVRRSESFRLGNLLLSPVVTIRRFVRAWRRAETPA